MPRGRRAAHPRCSDPGSPWERPSTPHTPSTCTSNTGCRGVWAPPGVAPGRAVWAAGTARGEPGWGVRAPAPRLHLRMRDVRPGRESPWPGVCGVCVSLSPGAGPAPYLGCLGGGMGLPPGWTFWAPLTAPSPAQPPSAAGGCPPEHRWTQSRVFLSIFRWEARAPRERPLLWGLGVRALLASACPRPSPHPTPDDGATSPTVCHHGARVGGAWACASWKGWPSFLHQRRELRSGSQVPPVPSPPPWGVSVCPGDGPGQGTGWGRWDQPRPGPLQASPPVRPLLLVRGWGH